MKISRCIRIEETKFNLAYNLGLACDLMEKTGWELSQIIPEIKNGDTRALIAIFTSGKRTEEET